MKTLNYSLCIYQVLVKNKSIFNSVCVLYFFLVLYIQLYIVSFLF